MPLLEQHGFPKFLFQYASPEEAAGRSAGAVSAAGRRGGSAAGRTRPPPGSGAPRRSPRRPAPAAPLPVAPAKNNNPLSIFVLASKKC